MIDFIHVFYIIFLPSYEPNSTDSLFLAKHVHNARVSLSNFCFLLLIARGFLFDLMFRNHLPLDNSSSFFLAIKWPPLMYLSLQAYRILKISYNDLYFFVFFPFLLVQWHSDVFS